MCIQIRTCSKITIDKYKLISQIRRGQVLNQKLWRFLQPSETLRIKLVLSDFCLQPDPEKQPTSNCYLKTVWSLLKSFTDLMHRFLMHRFDAIQHKWPLQSKVKNCFFYCNGTWAFRTPFQTCRVANVMSSTWQ